MTVTTSKQEKDLIPLHRVEIKRNGIVIREFASSSGYRYHTTIFEGRVSSCERTDGTPCPSWRYRHSCHHATLAMQLEAERDADRTAYNNYELAIGA